MTDLHRTFVPDLEVRSAAKGGDGRTIVGIAVPYGRPQRIDASLVEQFNRGAFNRQLGAAHRVPFAREHMSLGGTLIGKTMLLRDDAAGLYGEWRVSKTPAGEETLELVKDGVLTELSVGFREGQSRRGKGGVVERVTAHLSEVSVVLAGAYGEAAMVAGVRALQDHDQVGFCPNCSATTARLDEARQILAKLPTLPAAS
ncbi:HK97 family phage prohead protease [Pseudonocardia sp. WMMC193]|uniref:HK97 family phage prohead protease n=1 Tax=Pseudonocardia sp. WMMC193 TaxID=2911965 RepID=UPI001EFF7463|nr:HK97 family phage prohead protease [Pseudonocardia sp. WMMC193]MCF7548906.1 HK97 family phage prohead protease [Pseudonocardia sp. WMMC193]